MSEIKITKILLEKDGIEYVARPVNDEERTRLENELKAAGKAWNCNCGDEFCLDGWLYRCMYSGGGVCSWYITYIVC